VVSRICLCMKYSQMYTYHLLTISFVVDVNALSFLCIDDPDKKFMKRPFSDFSALSP